jgi:hypothetical protein
VEIENRGGEAATLVLPLYDSLRQRRYPRVEVTITTEEGKPVDLDLHGGPAKQEEMYESSFVRIAPGETLPIEIRWPYEMRGIPDPGLYRLSIAYDTRAPSIEAWCAWPPDDVSPADNPVGRRDIILELEGVDKVRLEAEATVTVHEVTPEMFQSMLLRSIGDETIASHLREAFADGDAVVDSIRPRGGATLVSVIFRDAYEPPVRARELESTTYVIEPALLRPGRVIPFEGFRGSMRFHVDPLRRIPLWRQQQLGLPGAHRDR